MVEEAVDYDELGKILGRLIGQTVAKEITSYAPLGQIIEEIIGREIGCKLEDKSYDWVREEVYEQPDKAPTTTPHTP